MDRLNDIEPFIIALMYAQQVMLNLSIGASWAPCLLKLSCWVIYHLVSS
jgi:hypothetical protein